MLRGDSDRLAMWLVAPASMAWLAFALFVNTLLSLLALGGAMSAYGAYRLWQGKLSHSWPKSNARIVSASIAEYSVAESKYYRTTYYYPKVEFTYIVNGQQHAGREATLDVKSVWNIDKSAVAAFLASFQPGSQVSAFVDPGQPQRAVLVPGLSSYRRSHYSAMVVAGLMIVTLGYVIHFLQRA